MFSLVKIEKEKLTRHAEIAIMINPPDINNLLVIAYHQVLKLSCQNGYIKYLTYVVQGNVVTIPGDHILEIRY